MSALFRSLIVLPLLTATGCVLRPQGFQQEQARLADQGQSWQRPLEHRTLPDLPAEPDWPDVLHRALLANGDVEAAWFDWKAAMERVNIAGTWPNSNVSIGFDYMFSADRMKSWDRTTVSAGFDSSKTPMLPNKVAKDAQRAFEQARAAGMKFQAAKFDVQRKVLTAWDDYALMAEQIRIQRDNLAILTLMTDSAAARMRVGAPQQDLLKAQISQRMAESDLADMEASLSGMRAMLNGMLARPADAPLVPPRQLPGPRPVPRDDVAILTIGIDNNPELLARAHEVAGSRAALELARLAYLPDISPTAAFTGSLSQSVGAMVMLPTQLPAIRGAIDEAQAMLRSTEAMTRQARSERSASFVAALVALRNNERQAALFQEAILPKARQSLESSRQAYSAGQIGFVELLDAQRTLFDVRKVIAQARMDREKRLAELEALAGVDIETLMRPAPTSTSAPTTQDQGHHHE